jgi:hypothetical protein
MGMVTALWKYLQTEKARRDFLDYVRAALVIFGVMAMMRIAIDMLH